MNDAILYLTRAEVELACRELDPVALMRQAFCLHGSGMTRLPDEAYLSWTNSLGERVRSLSMPGYLDAPFSAAGTKIINSNPANITRGIPRASGVTILFDADSTRVRCIMDSAYISSLRTASVSALAIELLRGPSISSCGLIGAGAIATAHLRLFLDRFPEIQRVRIYDHKAEAARRLAASDARCSVAGSAEQAIRGAEIVVTATTTTTGYVPFDWLQAGTVLVHVSLDDVLAEVALRCDLLVVDDWHLVRTDDKRLLGRMYRAGDLTGPGETAAGKRAVTAELGDLVTGRFPGRTRAGQIVLVNPFGLAIEDVAIASKVFEIARGRHMGTLLPR